MFAFFNIAAISSADAAPVENRYWVADINNCPNNKCLWSHSQNWAASQNGPSGASAPTTKNIKVNFNARSTVDAYLDLDIKKIKTLTIGNNYTGTLHLDGYHLQVQGNIGTKGGDISIGGTATTPYTGLGPFLQTFSDLYIYDGGTVTANGDESRIKVKKNLKIAGTLTAPNGNNTRFIVRGGFNLYSGGTFNHNSGTVLMNPRGTGYTINIEDGPGTNRNFYNLEKTANRTLTLSNDIEIENDFSIKKGIIQAQSHDITIKGNWSINQASNFQPGTGKVIFEGSSLQTIDGPTNFKALIISSPNVSLIDNTNVSNTLRINSGGSLDVNGKTLTASTLVNGGNLQLSGSETLNITTKDTDSGTITYDGTATGLNYGDTYYNLKLNTSGTMTLNADLDVDGDLTITNGTLDASSNNRAINVAGDWSNSGTFISRSGTVTFDGSSTITTGGIANINDFHHVTLSGTSAIQSTNAIDIDGNFTISSTGTWNTNNLCMIVNGTTTTGSGTLTNPVPTLSSSIPSDNATGVVADANIVLTFSEAVDVESGNITIKKSSDNSTVESIDVTGSLVTGTGTTTITINPTNNLASLTSYYLNIDATAFDDSCSNSYAGITDATTLSFTSADVDAPTLSSSIPSDNATGVAVDANIVLTFSKAVDVESGNITIKKSSDNSTVESIDVTGSLVTGTGTTTITINPTNNLASLTSYYLNIDATAFDDNAGNSYAGITDATTLSFTSADVVAPTLSSSIPSDNATGVAVDANIVLTFSEAVDVESGNITIKKSSDNSTVESIDVTGSLVTGTGTTTITINPTNNLASLTSYYLNIDATAFDDNAGNSYAGITDATTLSFTSADVVAPTLSSSTPSDDATGVAVDANIVLTFSEAVDVESGNITIKKSSDNSTVESIDVTGSLVTGTGTTTITINPTNNLASLTSYYLNIDATAFDDNAGNSYAGITDATTLSFTSADVVAPTLSSSIPSDNATGVVADANIVLTFSEAVDVESGNITIKKSSDNSTVESIDVTGSLVTGTGTTTITINPTNNLASLTSYYLNIDATAFDDNAGNSYAGITDATTLSFTSADVVAPTLSSSIPSDNATGVVADANIVLTFSEAVDVESGNITIKKSSDNSTVESIDVTGSLVTGTGTTTITINPTNNLASLTSYYLNIDATAFDDNAGNSYAGITDATTLSFTSADVVAPTLSSSIPSDNATGVVADANIVLTFSEAVDVESGNITIKKSSDNSTVESIDVTGSLVTGTGTTTITINPTNNLASLTSYYLNIDATAFDDNAGNSYAGITDATTLSFTSADVDAPTLSSSIPSDNATGVVADANIVLTFSKAVDVESGNITIKKSSDNSTVESIDVTGSLVTGTGTTTITINPTNNLASLTSYYLNIDATAFDDNAGNSYAGITNATTLSFTSADVVAPTLSSSIPSDNATGVAVDANIVLTFSEAVDVESGNITIKKSSDNSTVESIDVTGILVAGTGTTTITINPTNNLASLTSYYLNIDATAFDDNAGNSYAGITDATTLSFTSADVVAPTLSSSTPSDDATGVAVNANIVLTFSEAVDVESGNITIKKSSDNSTVESIDVTGSLVTGTGTTTITINPTNNLASLTSYYLNIDATAFDDNAGNSYAGITDATTLSFTSADVDAPTIIFDPANSSNNVAITSNITLTFNEAIRNTDDTPLTDSNISSLIVLKNSNLSGSDIPFASTIDTTKKIITINPTSNFSSEQVVYVAIGPTVEDSSDNVITTSSITFTAADINPPIIIFDPTDSADNVAITSNITLTFNEAIRNTDDTLLTDSNVDSLITLKDSDLSGSNISFNATIDSAKKVITINPTNNFSSEQVVYVAIGPTVEDSSDNAITTSSTTFTAADSTAPVLDFTPADLATGVAVNSDITIAFDEPIRNKDNSAITDSNVDSLITLKTTNSSGADIAFDAVIDNSKQLITIAPNNDFSSEQVVYVAIGPTVEDSSDNLISQSSITFTAADETAPTVAFVPPDASNCVPISSNVSLTFSEAVRNSDDSEITNSNVGSLITLEYTSDGSPVGFNASINSDKKIITINPNSDFISGEVVNVAIEEVEDLSDNSMSATSGTFCVVDSTPPVVTFSPANLSTMVAQNTDIILTFDEEIRLVNDSALNNTNVDSLITLKENDATGNDITFNATIDAENKVITIDLVNDLSSNQIVYVAIGSTVEDTYDNIITQASAIFTTGDSLPPTVSIDAVITASIATNSDITFTFSEPVRNLDNSALSNANVSSLITLKDTDDTGFDIPFTATINTAKTIITIDPTSNFSSQQVVYAAIGASVEDYADNILPASSKTFTAEYLKTELQNPLNEKDVVGLIEGQIETARKFTQHSTNPVLKRMEWLRLHRHNKNFSKQGVKLNFVNETMAEIANIAQLSNSINKTSNLLKNDWAIWSEGTITIGEIEETSTSSIRGIRSGGISLGIDKKINKNQMYGIALRIEDDKTNIGTSGTNLNTDKYSLSFYGTLTMNDNVYIDSAIGIGLLQTNSKRTHQSGTLYGTRHGDQIFGSVVFGRETQLYNKGTNTNQSSLSLYGRLDAAYTTLRQYAETGSVGALSYNDQKLKTARGSIGILVNDEIKFSEMTLMPNARLEYGWNVNNATNAVMSYIVYPNTNYTLVIDEKKKANIRLGLGVDIEVGKGLFFMADFERNAMDGTNHENTASMGLSIQPNSKSEYDLSLTKANNSLNQIDLNFNKKLNNNWSYNLGLGIKEKTNSGFDSDFKFNTRLNF